MAFPLVARFENRITHTGARPTRNVALAMVVLRMDKCQKPKSPANNMPASNAGLEILMDNCVALFLASQNAHKKRTGRANKTRQNALAKAPTSASRTNTGEKPMTMPPTNRAAIAAGNESFFWLV